MHSPLSNDKSIGMVPHIENPDLYRVFFNNYQHRAKTPLTILQGGRTSANSAGAAEALKDQNRTEMDVSQTISQIGGGEVQLISPSQASVERAKEGMKLDNKRKNIAKNIHSLIGLGKGKNKGKRSKKKTAGKKSTKSASKKRSQTKSKTKNKGKKVGKNSVKKGKKK